MQHTGLVKVVLYDRPLKHWFDEDSEKSVVETWNKNDRSITGFAVSIKINGSVCISDTCAISYQ